MPYLDFYIREADAPGVDANAFEVIALADASGVGAVITNVYGSEADLDAIAADVGKPISRLLVAVKDARDADTVERVSEVLAWTRRSTS